VQPPSSFFWRALPPRQPGSVDLLLLVTLMLYVIVGVSGVPFHGDESTQMFMSVDYHLLFIERDFDALRFRDDSPRPDLQYLRLINGSIQKYLGGLGWHLAGYTVEDVNNQWDWGGDWEYNVSAGHLPSPGMLLAGRYPSAVLAALSIAVIFALGWWMSGRPVAWIASLYYALNPVILMNGRRGMMEGSNLLGGLLLVLAGAWFLHKPSWGRALLLGVAGGVAMSAKHTNLFALVGIFGACVLYPLIAQLLERRARQTAALRIPPSRMALLLILASFTLALTFALLNPVWWGSNPLEHTFLILRLRSELLAGQTATFGGYADRLDQLAGFGRQVLVALPQYYEVPNWGGWIGDQIASYETSPWRGVSIGGSTLGALAVLILLLFGAGSFLRDRAKSLALRWLIGCWALVLVASTLVLTPVEWQRYYLPVFPVVALLGAVGLVSLIGRVRAAVLRRR
jgi:4-amino-4-deoxy-L-arabinose transferase-like glycosyltransferase